MDDNERAEAEFKLKMELMQMDLNLKTKQAFWETPRNIAILLATAIAISGWAGFRLGKEPAPPPVVINLQGTAPATVPAK